MQDRYLTPVVLARTIAEGEEFVRSYSGLRGAIIVSTESALSIRKLDGLLHPAAFIAPRAEMGRYAEEAIATLRCSALKSGPIPRHLAWGVHG